MGTIMACTGATAGGSRAVIEYAGRGTSFYQWYDEQVGNAACDYLREISARGTPFAAVVGFHVTHSPFIAPRDLFDYYYPRVSIPRPVEDEPPLMRAFGESRGFLAPPIPEERVQIARAAYYGMCEYGDAQIGRVLDTIETCGLADCTIVVYCSDHGEMAGEHGCWTKSCFHEASAGIPLIVRHPDGTAAGSACGIPCSLVDLGPTLAELAGVEIRDVDGRSLVPELAGTGEAESGQTAFCEMSYRPQGTGRMVRQDRWKLWHVDPPSGEALPPVLFDLSVDPGETNDLGSDPAHADIRRQLTAEVTDGWNPSAIRAEIAQQRRDMTLLAAWGRRTMPECEDTIAFAGPELEDDLDLRGCT